MDRVEIYRARAGAGAEVAVSDAGVVSPFTIEVRFLGGLSEAQKDAFRGAADRWSRIIVGDLPAAMVDGEVIDDVVIEARGSDIDGPGGILGQAGPSHLRPHSAGSAALIPAKGRMTFDTADLQRMEQQGTLTDVITHEMGHVLGMGTIWRPKGFLIGIESDNPTFQGAAAMQEYGRLRGDGAPTPVPVENTGGLGTRNSHWRETIFRTELMSGFISAPGNPISRVTVACLQDLGYVVDFSAAEAFVLPDLFALAEEGLLVPHEAPIDSGVMLPIIPQELPEGSLQ